MNYVSKEEWIDQINKELKTSSWEEKFIQLSDRLGVPCAFHPEDVQGKKWNPVLTVRLFDPYIGHSFPILDSKLANQQILNSLGFGLESPELILDENWDQQVEELFKGIHIDWLHWIVKGTNQSIDIIRHHFEKEEGNISLQTGEVAKSESLEESMERFARQLLSWSNNKEDKLHYFQVYVGENYLEEIAKLRAMRRMYSNFCKAQKMEQKAFFLDVLTRPRNVTRTEDSQLIANTTMAMSALVGGADRLSVTDSNFPDYTPFRQHLSLTLQQLLKMESQVHRVIDPLCGSYWVEETTDLIAREYWSFLQKI